MTGLYFCYLSNSMYGNCVQKIKIPNNFITTMEYTHAQCLGLLLHN